VRRREARLCVFPAEAGGRRRPRPENICSV
jgi:hypothetical protein